MSMRVNRLVYALVATALAGALAVGLLMSASSRPESTLAASQTCYGPCRVATHTTLSLSRRRVIYGHERAEKFGVSVTSAPGNGVPTGLVAVKSGTRTLCTIHLRHGKGQCSMSNRELRPGRYKNIVAHYRANGKFKASRSTRKTLIVRKH